MSKEAISQRKGKGQQAEVRIETGFETGSAPYLDRSQAIEEFWQMPAADILPFL